MRILWNKIKQENGIHICSSAPGNEIKWGLYALKMPEISAIFTTKSTPERSQTIIFTKKNYAYSGRV